MIRSVHLDRLPDGLEFPHELQAKVAYDSDRRQLRFEGFMSKTDFDKLVRLHNDLAYQRSLQQLFQTCTFTAKATHPARRQPMVLTGLAAAAFLVTLLIAAAAVWWR
jgi:hypothetical protein